jgi:hypothetical protein
MISLDITSGLEGPLTRRATACPYARVFVYVPGRRRYSDALALEPDAIATTARVYLEGHTFQCGALAQAAL